MQALPLCTHLESIKGLCGSSGSHAFFVRGFRLRTFCFKEMVRPEW